MSLTTETNLVQYDVSGGYNATYPITFPYFDEEDIKVTLVDDDGVEYEKDYGDDYSVSTAPASSGTLTIIGTWETADTMTIYRNVPRTQPSTLVQGGKIKAGVLMTQMDRQVAMIQELAERETNRLVRAPVTDEDPDMTLPAAALRALNYVHFDADGNVGISSGVSSTPVSTVWADVISEATIALGLVAMGITSSVDELNNLDGMEATTFLQWEGYLRKDGTPLSIAGIGHPALAALDSTHVAFIDDVGEQLKMYEWDGTDWTLDGSGLAIAGIDAPTLAALDSTHVAFFDITLAELRTYVWGGSSWTLDGTPLSIGGSYQPDLAALDSTHVAFIDTNNEELRTYEWSGSAWSLDGTPLSIAGIGHAAISALDSTHIAFLDSTYDELRTYEWSGSAWSLDGTGLNIEGAGHPALAALDANHVAFIDSDREELRLYKWSGSAWSLYSASLSISTVGLPALAALDSNHVAFIDLDVEELTMYFAAKMPLFSL